ncbi:MAG: electron transfer flavoprotein subunit beta/FixA family protein [Bdellovibrionales bacterium]|nr:electron transfer flavoprotein subunit beta/FixA family protein [Bdellovibrionales bacterium]
MKILVPIKRVPDYEAKIRINNDGNGVVTDGIKWIVNPFDEIAVEEAIKIRDGGGATEVVVVGIGPADVVTQMRYAMAMGADRGILVQHDGNIDSDLASRVLAEVYKRDQYGLVLMGKQAIDSDANQTAQLLAARLELPQACFASKVELGAGEGTVTREVDGGLETIKIPLPAVISTDLRLNEPRYASLPGIMKAKKKQLDEIAIADLGVQVTTKVNVIRMSPPPGRSAGRKVEDVAALVAALKDEAKVL